jgi:single-strand DNA-binding protein
MGGPVFLSRRRSDMNNLNSILIEGNLVRDPDLKTTPKGTPLCTFSIAVNRYFKQDSGTEKEVGYFNVETWGKLAESAGNLGRKGRGVRVVGRLKQERWADREGKTQSKVVIAAEHLEFRPEFTKTEAPEAEAEMEETGESEEAFAPTF